MDTQQKVNTEAIYNLSFDRVLLSSSNYDEVWSKFHSNWASIDFCIEASQCSIKKDGYELTKQYKDRIIMQIYKEMTEKFSSINSNIEPNIVFPLDYFTQLSNITNFERFSMGNEEGPQTRDEIISFINKIKEYNLSHIIN